MLFALMGTTALEAQTSLHIDLARIVSQLPETPGIDSLLRVKGASYKVVEDSIAQEFKSLQGTLASRIESGSITQKEINDGNARLQMMEKQLGDHRQSAIQGMELYRQELVQPILTRIYEEVARIAKERKASIVYDRASGSILYLDEGGSIDDLVKKAIQ